MRERLFKHRGLRQLHLGRLSRHRVGKLRTAAHPKNSAERLERTRIIKSRLIAKIGLLGLASTYNRASLLADCNTASRPAWAAIDRCKIQLRSAQHGVELLSKQEVVDTLSPNRRERLTKVYATQAEQYRGQLDVIAASWTGDPSALCSETYVSVSACRRAVAANTDALRRQVFPIYRCGRVVPGQFVTATTGKAEEARHANDPPLEKMLWRMSTFPFSDAVRIYRNRLDTARSLLSQAQHTYH